MDKKKYDLIFVTNLPSFYKINLYNRINEKRRVFIIFTGDTAEVRNKDFFSGDYQFEFVHFSKETAWEKARKAHKIVKSLEYMELVIGGWDSITLWYLAFMCPRVKNSVVIESSYLESTTKSIRGMLKRIFLKRIKKAYVPGKSNAKLLQQLGFKNDIIMTKGVGIFNIVQQPEFSKRDRVKNFLYVGRLSPEKNLFALIEAFNDLPNLTLNIVGFGPLEDKIKTYISKNINYLGAVNNKQLPEIYKNNDVFILPSLSEVWGLVIEEALNNGLPVIASNYVGCGEEIINDHNGIIFSLEVENDLKNSIIRMTDIDYYNRMRKNISEYNFYEIAEEQVNSYL